LTEGPTPYRQINTNKEGCVNIALIGLVAVAVLIILEVSLRLLFGFGSPLLYIADSQIGYLLAPDQQTRRFGNQISINHYSMRSADISPSRSKTTLRILLLGDSIANGGWWTDQNNTISALLQQQLQSAGTVEQVEVLNASANSWGPRNELAYLQRFGKFEAQVIVLLINTDDLFATAPTSLPVGRDRNYPDHKPPFALAEAANRFVKPAPIPELQAVQQEEGDRVGLNLEAIRQIKAIATQTNGKFLLALTPLLREIGEPGSRDYEQKARQRLTNFAQQEEISFIDFLPVFNAMAAPKALYHDHIHLNLQGNQQVTQRMSEKMEEMVKEE
jgi:lysophospholipase L1-like esterase